MKRFLIMLMLCALMSAPVLAAPAVFGDGGTNLQGVLDGITVGGSSSIDVTADALSDLTDSYWSVAGSGGSVATVIKQYTLSSVAFGIYDAANPNAKVELFDGSELAGDLALVSIGADGSVYKNLTDTGIDFGRG